MGTFVENVNRLATKLTDIFIDSISAVSTNEVNITTVGTNIADVNTVAADIVNIDNVATTVVPNILEILQVNDNTLIVQDLYDQFDDRYLGSKVVEPLLDNDGNALLIGALYFDSVTNKMRVYGSDLLWSDALTLTAGSVSTLTNKTIDSITNKVGADHVHYKVRNESGSIIPVNTVVTASGTQPGTDYILVVPITDPQTQIALGIVHTALSVNGTGLVINTGVADDVDTSAWVVGTILYPNTTGGLTVTKPTSGRYQACAIVLRQHANQGTLLCEFTEPKDIASITQSGYVQLNNTLTSVSITEALTAAQGKVLNDRLVVVENGTVQEGDSVTLTGDVTGTATFDANGNVSVTTIVGDDSHAHTISTVTGLQTALDSKVDENLAIVAGTATKITYDTKGLVTAGTILAATDIPSLDASKITTGIIDAARLPAYVDDVLEYANLATFPVTGVSGVIYIAIDTNRSYRWSGTAYVDITGKVDSVNGATGTVVLSATNIGSTAIGGITATNVQAAIQELDSEKAPLDSATLTGVPTAPTAAVNTNTTQIATTAYVQGELTDKANIEVISGAVFLGSGTTLQRPTLLSTARAMWYNTDLQKFEGWNGTQWVGVGGGATGGGADTVFVETSYTVTQNYTLTTGKSAMTVGNANGDVVINDGVTVTIPDSSSWVILGA